MTTVPPTSVAPPSTVVEQLRAALDTLGKRDQLIARFVIDHAEELPFLSAGEIAERLGVSGPAITRFSQRVGFEGYPHLQRLVRQDLRATLGVKQPGRQDAVAASYWASERANLEVLQGIGERQLLPFAAALTQARQVWIIGARSSYGVALIAESLLSPFRPRVRAHSADTLSGQPEQLLEVNAEDVALVYTLRRYSRATTRVTTALNSQGATVLLITDQGASPLGKLAHQSLRVPTQGSEVVASLAPFISVTALLATLVARELGGGHLQQAETLKADFSVYEY
jgi:DNA-binding MurR/RpiR family transcriptional regulator